MQYPTSKASTNDPPIDSTRAQKSKDKPDMIEVDMICRRRTPSGIDAILNCASIPAFPTGKGRPPVALTSNQPLFRMCARSASLRHGVHPVYDINIIQDGMELIPMSAFLISEITPLPQIPA